jgi:hypothetical protein
LTEIDFRAGHHGITFGKAQYQTAPRPEKGPRPAPPVTALPNKIFLGLMEANRQQLLEASVLSKGIWTSRFARAAMICCSLTAAKMKNGPHDGSVGNSGPMTQTSQLAINAIPV